MHAAIYANKDVYIKRLVAKFIDNIFTAGVVLTQL